MRGLLLRPARGRSSTWRRCADHADFHAAISAYLATLPEGCIEHGGVVIANPVEGDSVRMTNYHWQFSIEQMRQRLQLETLVVVNDFTALAMALPRLQPNQRRQIGGGEIRARSVVGLLGAGSGLGVSGLTRPTMAGSRSAPKAATPAFHRATSVSWRSCATPGASTPTFRSNACCQARALS